jgi:hypothetical protein
VFVVTADQVDSSHTPDLAGSAVRFLNRDFGAALAAPADRNAGDEIQALTDDPMAATRIVLELTRHGQWSVGLGVGGVRKPLPASTREANGPAFVAARNAVTRAKGEPLRFAVEATVSDPAAFTAAEVEAVFALVLMLRQKRSAAGWELYELLERGLSGREAAERLSISAPAVSSRAKAAGLRAESAALPALIKLLTHLDRAATETDEHT